MISGEELVRIANGCSSRKSRRVRREPGASFSLLTSASETSRVIGMLNNSPSANLKVSTTLVVSTESLGNYES
jgi:hypothetical protein